MKTTNDKQNKIKIGDEVTFISWGVEKTATVTNVSRDGKVLFFGAGKWMHSISCTKINN